MIRSIKKIYDSSASLRFNEYGAKPMNQRQLHCALTLVVAIALSFLAGPAPAQSLDNLCGCKGHPKSLGDFDLRDEKTWPEGSRLDGTTLFFALPPDGVLVFDGFKGLRKEGDNRHWYLRFDRNAENTPVSILVAGDFELAGYVDLYLDGTNGGGGNQHMFGIGGAPGPGGFRGGDGAFFEVNDANQGGVGLGPKGGVGGTAEPLEHGQPGEFPGNRELRPLIGGSGGGGGSSSQAGNCSGGGGGGGGGAILIAVNGKIVNNAAIVADGGHGGGHSNGECSRSGGPGSGGAIRLIATKIEGGGYLYARGNRGSGSWKPGIIRLESVEEMALSNHRLVPTPIRSSVPSPLFDPVPADIRITAVGGQTAPPKRTGKEGAVEILLPKPGKTPVQLQTRGVPAGTTVEVTMKAKAGGQVLSQRGELNPKNCKKDGSCTLVLDFELPTGAWFAEASASFEAP